MIPIDEIAEYARERCADETAQFRAGYEQGFFEALSAVGLDARYRKIDAMSEAELARTDNWQAEDAWRLEKALHDDERRLTRRVIRIARDLHEAEFELEPPT